ncbi:hypothetical protein [uncultured Psychroserpens sp.]|uniref:hypothetical protein n=1 Tax=uncultured Psychroserpens sp. TaxID=255436 RepID=UPI00260E3EA5|nr:hypothetical protein [uncultured Psychroserpens sp.]
MKTKLTLFFLLCILIGYAQNGINYKAVIKDDNGNVIANQSVTLQLTISENATNVYQETHVESTDDNGILIVGIGEGASSLGDFATIDWGSNPHFLKVEIDTGDGLVDAGTSQFKTVPYALSSADASWSKSGADIYRVSGNISIGSNTPTNAKTRILHNSTIFSPQLFLYEDQLDFARLNFGGSNSASIWAVAASVYDDPVASRFNIYNSNYGDIMSIRGNGRIGIVNAEPEQKLDVNGKIKIADDNTTPTEGTMRYNSVTKNFEGYDGNNWVILNNNPSFNVTTITAPDNDTQNYTDFTFISGSRISFSIDFSAPMNISSAVIGSSILIGDDGTGTGTMNWSNGDTRLTITTDQSYFDLSADCFSGVPIILKGDGINQLLDANNLTIDGDDDGVAGGDFVVIFVTIC